jgi:hypothetical protein
MRLAGGVFDRGDHPFNAGKMRTHVKDRVYL